MAGNGANQFTKAIEEGREPPSASNQFIKGTRSKHDEATKDKIRAEIVAQRLFRFAVAKGEKQLQKYGMDPAQVAASKALMDKGKPNLQAIEQTSVDSMESKSPEDIESMVRALITANPELLAKLNLTAKPVLASSSEGNEADQSVIPLSNAALRA